jgi:glutamate synthase domain-containing protein 1
VSCSIDKTRSQLFRRDSNGEVERSEEEEFDESDVFRTRARIDRSMDIQAAPQMGEEEESRNMFNFVNDEEEIPIEEEILDQSNDSADERLNSEGSSSDDDDDEEREEDITIDQSKEMQAARLALLRKRRIKKKAKRYVFVFSARTCLLTLC